MGDSFEMVENIRFSLINQMVLLILIFDITGDLVYLNAVGQDIIYINSFDVATELLEKRSSLYSDRVQSTMLEL